VVWKGSHPVRTGTVTRPALPRRARSRFLCLRAVACQDRLAPTTTSVVVALGCASRVTVLLGRVHHPTPCRLNAISSWACSARARLKASMVPCTSLRSTWASTNVSCRRMLFPRYKPREIARLGFSPHELVRTRLRHRRKRRGAS